MWTRKPEGPLLKGIVLLQGSFSFSVPTTGRRESTWAGRAQNGTRCFGSVSHRGQPPASCPGSMRQSRDLYTACAEGTGAPE